MPVLKTNSEKLKWYWNTGGELVTRKTEERWVFTVEANSVKLRAERAEGLDPALKEKLSALDDDSNPVLFFYRMR